MNFFVRFFVGMWTDVFCCSTLSCLIFAAIVAPALKWSRRVEFNIDQSARLASARWLLRVAIVLQIPPSILTLVALTTTLNDAIFNDPDRVAALPGSGIPQWLAWAAVLWVPAGCLGVWAIWLAAKVLKTGSDARRYWITGFVLSYFLGFGLVPSITLCRKVSLRHRRLALGLCTSCGYDLRGHGAADRCPECGAFNRPV